MRGWQFPEANPAYRKYVYRGEVGDGELRRPGGFVVVERWDGIIPDLPDSWGRGVPVALTCLICNAGEGEEHAAYCSEKPTLTASERGAGLKFDGGKPRWALLMKGCAKALAGVVRVLTFGAKKYSADAWRSVENGGERYRDALYRHLHAVESGEEIDPESGESHWSHIATNALFLEELRVAGKPE